MLTTNNGKARAKAQQLYAEDELQAALELLAHACEHSVNLHDWLAFTQL